MAETDIVKFSTPTLYDRYMGPLLFAPYAAYVAGRAALLQIDLETVALSSHVTASEAAKAIVLGSPFRAEIERREPSGLDRALHAVSQALAPWDGKDALQSVHVATASK